VRPATTSSNLLRRSGAASTCCAEGSASLYTGRWSIGNDTLSKEDIAIQMLLHEVHHRAQAMVVLRQLGVPAENLDYARFVVRREEYQEDSAL
jgi:hypothetical protein